MKCTQFSYIVKILMAMKEDPRTFVNNQTRRYDGGYSARGHVWRFEFEFGNGRLNLNPFATARYARFTCPFHLFTLFKIHRLIWNTQTRASKVTARSAAHWLLRTNGAAARSSAWPPLLAILQMPANRQKKTIPQGIYIEAVALNEAYFTVLQ